MAGSKNGAESLVHSGATALAASLAASLLVGCGTAILFGFLNEPSSDATFWTGLSFGFRAFLLCALVSLPASIFVGLPAHYALQRRGLTGWRIYTLLGAAAAVALTVIVATALTLSSIHAAQIWLYTVAWAVPTGSLTAFIAWLIRRPDRDVRD